MSTLYGASVTLAEPVSYSWWIQNGCAVNPQCQGISDLFGTVANVTWGYAPDYVRSWWVSANCTTVPANRFEICHRAADTFGIVSGVTWGYAPDYVRAWWIDNQCQLQF
jgi:hypothetical protein